MGIHPLCAPSFPSSRQHLNASLILVQAFAPPLLWLTCKGMIRVTASHRLATLAKATPPISRAQAPTPLITLNKDAAADAIQYEYISLHYGSASPFTTHHPPH